MFVFDKIKYTGAKFKLYEATFLRNRWYNYEGTLLLRFY